MFEFHHENVCRLLLKVLSGYLVGVTKLYFNDSHITFSVVIYPEGWAWYNEPVNGHDQK